MPLTCGSELLQRTVQDSFWNSFFYNYSDPLDSLYAYRPSTAIKDTMAWLSDPPMPGEWIGDTNYDVLNEYSMSIINKFWRSAIPFAKEHVKFEQLSEAQTAAQRLAQKARMHMTYLLSNLLNNGAATACYDGQNYFDTDHADPGAPYQTSQSNDLTSNITTVTAPTDLEMYAAIAGMQTAHRGFRDSQGDPIVVGDDHDFVLVVPPMYTNIARQIKNNDLLTGSVSNDLKGTFELRTLQFLTAPTSSAGAMYLFDRKKVRKGLIIQVANSVELDDEDIKSTGQRNYYATWVGREAYADWRAVVSHIFT